MCANYYFYLLYFTLFQFIPAILLDICAVLAGQKRWAIKLQRRIFDSLKVFSYFVNNSWKWDTKNAQLLSRRLNVEERYESVIINLNWHLNSWLIHSSDKFNFDVEKLDFHQYAENWVIGSRRFIMKLDDSSIPEAKRKFVFLFWLDVVVKSLFMLGFGYFMFRIYGRIGMKPLIKIP